MSDQIQDLIARLEKASGPDRELDADICELVGAYRKDWRSVLSGYSLGYFITWSNCALHYTASIDSALTLVPEGWFCAGLSTGDKDRNPKNDEYYPHCVVQPTLGNDAGWQVGIQAAHRAPTPALALCIAALRARAALSGKGEAS